MPRRIPIVATFAVLFLFAAPAVTYACGGLIAPNGAVNLVRTTTLAGYHDGVEHYVTAFNYTGATENFGSIVPLPGIPTKVERGGDWTLQRLLREVEPVAGSDGAAGTIATAALGSARVMLETKIDALDITVLEGGAREVARWAKDHGFELSPDAPEVLAFYAKRSKIFLAARFDAAEAARRGQGAGDGTPIHVTIPTPNPWVPLRILSLAKPDTARVEADLFLLTDREPLTTPTPLGGRTEALTAVADGLSVELSERASPELIADLRSDKGMGWIPPRGMWLSHLLLDVPASRLRYDLAIDAAGRAEPAPVAAGLVEPRSESDLLPASLIIRRGRVIDGGALIAAILALATAAALGLRRRAAFVGR